MILEVKGQETQQDKVKKEYLTEWVNAVNQYGGFGEWRNDVISEPEEIEEKV